MIGIKKEIWEALSPEDQNLIIKIKKKGGRYKIENNKVYEYGASKRYKFSNGAFHQQD